MFDVCQAQWRDPAANGRRWKYAAGSDPTRIAQRTAADARRGWIDEVRALSRRVFTRVAMFQGDGLPEVMRTCADEIDAAAMRRRIVTPPASSPAASSPGCGARPTPSGCAQRRGAAEALPQLEIFLEKLGVPSVSEPPARSFKRPDM